MIKLKERNHTIDAFRVLAIFGVVAIHIKNDTSNAALIGNFFTPLSVPFFYIVSLLYFIIGLKSVGDNVVKKTFHKTFYRIVLPYLIWTVIYVLLRVIKAQLIGAESGIVFWRAFFYGESAVQLYFIPYLLSMQAIILSLYLLFKGNVKNKFYGITLLISTALFLKISIVNNCFGNSIGFVLIGIPSYISFAFLSTLFLSNRINIKTVCIGATIIAVIVALIENKIDLTISDYSALSPLLAFGLLLMGIGLYDSIRLPLVLTSATYGVYLAHILILEGFEFIIDKAQIILNYGFFEKLLLTVFIFGISIILLLLIRKYSLLRIFLLGEK
ncbi:acyltransferase family protein [Flavobacterium ovatum]|uniref:acyltransferase family protein n=1 Tax=Flavobacterium ovatum TaxID=1928857 RepID=UPI0034510313